MSSSTPRNREKHFAFADGPLAEYAQQFKGHMEAQHYSKATIYQYHCSIDAFFKILKDSKIEIRSIDEGQVGNLIAASNRPRLGKYDVFIVQAFIRFLSGMGVTKPLPPQPLDESPQGVLRREYEVDLPPKLRQPVKSQNSANGEFDSWEHLEESSRKK